MLSINITKTNEVLTIKWQFSTFTIPLEDIIEVKKDETYGGQQADAIRIGTPYGTTDRIYIKTKNQTYLIFTTNVPAVLKEIS
ncbi:PH domain-containing protein [Priestia flexa]|jgi:hypothetical protein|uniref:Sublancin immunity protein SunI-like PH domain-containing protein n=1 Tax=Priestia flexa TaxID=86664 RepID=A0A8I1MFW5_9BACI|nr:hypothetical protein [Priestia flexa]MBN8251626.1 hypothetical protein [Priestia flexa]MBN8434956.1 hypothetical protein [Priestia flexa]MCA0967735.1 PH domain-containing protein [Priestia flexa]UIR28892.1 PH domain-containing protein [Priestia flexa]